jgi:hypothetical protein
MFSAFLAKEEANDRRHYVHQIRTCAILLVIYSNGLNV